MESEDLHGLPILDDLIFCHRLFGDDMGMFIPAIEVAFWEARNVISLYKMVVGAQLNLAKSTVIPFGVPDIPLWLLNSGCKISSPREIHKYLGRHGALWLGIPIFSTSVLLASARGIICGLIACFHSRDAHF